MEVHMFTNFPVSVVFHNTDGDAFPPVFMESLPSARVYANIVLRMEVSGCSAAVITTADHAEVMRPVHALDFVWAPLADVENLPTLGDHYPLMRLARHFQMAGAVDQARVERLAVFMRAGKSVAEQEAFKIEFLDHHVGASGRDLGPRNTDRAALDGGYSDEDAEAEDTENVGYNAGYSYAAGYPD
jgi:hypothetical protein